MAHLTPQHIEVLYEKYGEIKILDDVIRNRALDDPPTAIFGYPRYEDRVDQYESFTGRDFDRFIDEAVRYFIGAGLKPVSNLLCLEICAQVRANACLQT